MDIMSRALIWENLAKSRYELLICFLIIPFGWMAIGPYIESLSNFDENSVTAGSKLVYGGTMMFLSVLFSYQGFSKQATEIDLSFPRHVLLLPAPSWKLALIPIVLMSLVLSAFTIIWWNVIRETDWTAFDQAWLCLGILAMASWIQALIWGFSKSVLQKSLFLVATATLTIVSLQSVLIEQVDSSILGRQYGGALLLILIISGYGLAFLTVSRSRSNKPVSINFYQKFGLEKWYLNSSFYRRLLDVPHFSNQKQAQGWYEWKKFGWIVPGLILFVGVLAFIGAIYTQKIQALAILTIVVCYLIPFFGPEVASTGFGKYDYKLPEFLVHLPISDYQIAKSKLLLLLKSQGLSYGLVIPIYVLTFIFTDSIDSSLSMLNALQQQFGTYEVNVGIMLGLMMVPFCIWMISTNLMALFLRVSSSSKLIKHVIVPLVVIFIFFSVMEGVDSLTQDKVILWIENHYYQVLIIPVLAALSLLGYCAYQARSLVEHKDIANVGSGLVGSWIVTVALLSMTSFSLQWISFVSMLFGVVFIMSLLPWIAAPLAVKHNRHTCKPS